MSDEARERLEGRHQPGEPNRGLATWWFAASIVAAGCVLVLLVRSAQGERWLLVPGAVAVVLLVTFAQYQFQETHRRVHHQWPEGLEGFWTGTRERRELIRAWTRRDPVAAVEFSRLAGLALLGLGMVAGLILIAIATSVR